MKGCAFGHLRQYLCNICLSGTMLDLRRSSQRGDMVLESIDDNAPIRTWFAVHVSTLP
jgi:hypothetical protein